MQQNFYYLNIKNLFFNSKMKLLIFPNVKLGINHPYYIYFFIFS